MKGTRYLMQRHPFKPSHKVRNAIIIIIIFVAVVVMGFVIVGHQSDNKEATSSIKVSHS